MSLLTLKSLSLTLGAPLFEGLDLTLNPGDRLGLVAANGRGKSSLMRLIAEGGAPTSGEIATARGLKVALLEQQVPGALLGQSVRTAACARLDPEMVDYESWRAEIALDDLGVSEELRDRPLGALSGGWQRLVLLAGLAVTEPDLLLLDEPTNHLDLARIGQLQDWLAALPARCGIIVTSHDRAFLDAATNRTLFLRPGGSRDFALPYSQARAALDEADAADARQFAGEMKRARQLRQQAAKLKNVGVNSGSDLLTVKSKQLRERAEKLEEAARPAHAEQSAGRIRLDSSDTHARALVSFEAADVVAPGGRVLYRMPKMWIAPGDRVVLLGPNGAGKSRLIEAVRAACRGNAGPIRTAATLKAGEMGQGLDQLDGFCSPMEAVTQLSSGGDARARAALAGAGIGIDLQTRPLDALSGGQRARLVLLMLRLTKPTLFLLDEPTNHLDIEGQEALQGELLSQGAACLLVSHDRAFVRAVATRVWSIEAGRLVERDDPEPVLERLMAG
ncbi:ABC-F family ATP-binding cassette domain-containing protein [Alloyangia pacifica]|uniref:ATPase components of ABC transporters with duplicated ATPase domains n=1 Tax=Alloyangia pacifica TaxID=311180 RepID=A0A1I6QEB2_9RHOB|nr:ABC-F family ATP-binding cassette domain-containing protein [Alloyangia pacifica]SDF87956.1 ATPase components of ABC transporters with duplicated ATPase domains [Alloyangia pacifica]SFS50806.1 ATPase components of ABC transporters with duplicated ATPase domains [Alloyangia pacifica]